MLITNSIQRKFS